MHTPSYVHLNGFGIYYFRMAIPRQLKPILGQHELKYSLRTTNYTPMPSRRLDGLLCMPRLCSKRTSSAERNFSTPPTKASAY